jgi:pimeloyl-ACP methyl ester carboxylesterase
MYRDLLPKLAPHFYVVAPDYPGFGYSDAPAPDKFTYSFDRLSEVVERFLNTIGVQRFSLYMQDYGGPVGLRIASRNPARVQGLIVQNANAYREGISPLFDGLLRPLWERRSAATEEPVLKLFKLDGTMFQYKTGTRNSQGVNPDSWTHDQARLDRPGNDRIQLELQANYHTNLASYEWWHSYFREHQPPTLVVRGKGDPLFTVEGANAYKRDLRNIEVHLLDTGHFALEEESDTIAGHIIRFLGKHAR